MMVSTEDPGWDKDEQIHRAHIEIENLRETIARLEEEVAYLERLKDWYKNALDEFKQRTDELIKKFSRGL